MRLGLRPVPVPATSSAPGPVSARHESLWAGPLPQMPTPSPSQRTPGLPKWLWGRFERLASEVFPDCAADLLFCWGRGRGASSAPLKGLWCSQHVSCQQGRWATVLRDPYPECLWGCLAVLTCWWGGHGLGHLSRQLLTEMQTVHQPGGAVSFGPVLSLQCWVSKGRPKGGAAGP